MPNKDQIKGSESFRRRNPNLFAATAPSPIPAANSGIVGDDLPFHAPTLLIIVIPTQIHGGKNAIKITRSGRRYPDKKWAEWRDKMVAIVKKQLPLGFKTITEPVNVRIDYTTGDKRRRDFPAICDSIWHILEKACVVSDDVLLWPKISSRKYDKSNPNAVIEFL